MKKFGIVTACFLAVASLTSTAYSAPVYLDIVTSNNIAQISSYSDTPGHALGTPDLLFTSIDTGEYAVFEFSDNIRISTGTDITFREIGRDFDSSAKNAKANVSISKDNVEWVTLGLVEVTYGLYTNTFQAGNYTYRYADKELDLDSTGLDWFRFIKFEGDLSTGNVPGIDIDAAWGQPVPIPGAAWILGSGLLALVGLKKNRRK